VPSRTALMPTTSPIGTFQTSRGQQARSAIKPQSGHLCISALRQESKADAKVRAAITRHYPHLTAVALNDLLYQVQSQTGTAVLG
jgi:hypothetical protein